jgi:hypothetical protein
MDYQSLTSASTSTFWEDFTSIMIYNAMLLVAVAVIIYFERKEK